MHLKLPQNSLIERENMLNNDIYILIKYEHKNAFKIH